MTRIVIGGDVRPTQHDVHLFEAGDVDRIFGPMLPHLTSADLSIVNLEAPLISQRTPISKSGQNFGVSAAALNALKGAGIELLNLGNNHLMDHGKYGFETTIEAVNREGFQYVGAGACLTSAAHPAIFTLDEKRVGVFSFADTEFSIAGQNSPGANPLDVIRFVRTYRRAKQSLDHSIVLLHAGKEHYKYPSPKLQQVCRFMIEEGVNVVVCQHSHMPGAIEEYLDGLICYGQGNFIFNSYPDPRPWLYQGFLLSLEFTGAGLFEYELLPFEQLGSSPGLRTLSADERKSFLDEVDDSILFTKDMQRVEEMWDEFCSDKASLYFSILRGQSRLGRFINRFIHTHKAIYSKQGILTLLNVLRCQAHSEVLLSVLQQEAKRKISSAPRPGDYGKF